MIYTANIYTVSKKLLSLILAIFVLIGLSGCTTDNQSPKIKTIKIGVIAPLSGPAANYGEDAVNAYQMVADNFNNKNSNIKIQLVIEDDKANPKDAVSAAQKLITVDGVKVIVGPLFSAPTVPVSILAQQSNIILLTPTASAASISNLGKYIYRFWNDEFATKLVSKYLNKQKIKDIVYIGENTDSGIDYYKGLEKYFSGNITKLIYPPDEKDFAAFAKQINSASQDAGYLVFFPASDVTAVSAIKAMKKEGLLERFENRILTNEIIINDSAISQLGSLVEGFKTATFALTLKTPDIAENFIAQFKQKYEMKGAPYLLLLEAEGLSLVIDTIQKVGNDPTAISIALDKINSSNPREGLFGKYYFDNNGDALGLDFVLQSIINGETQIIQ
ncbi:MAG: ABC transporter substrate-binding protein [Candidatus Absconditicoccaceae bacterium]